MKRIAAVTMLLLGVTSAVFAIGGITSPEIDPATGIAGLTLLAGAVLIIRARRKA